MHVCNAGCHGCMSFRVSCVYVMSVMRVCHAGVMRVCNECHACMSCRVSCVYVMSVMRVCHACVMRVCHECHACMSCRVSCVYVMQGVMRVCHAMCVMRVCHAMCVWCLKVQPQPKVQQMQMTI